MEWSAVEWNGMESMECSAVEWNGMESMECSAVEWNVREKNVCLVFRTIRQFPFFESGSFVFFLRGAFENGLKKKACHKISILKNAFLLWFFNVCL